MKTMSHPRTTFALLGLLLFSAWAGRTATASAAPKSAAAPVPTRGSPMTTASRVTGVAPLSVFFDAVDTIPEGTASPFAWASGVVQPTDREGTRYDWDFGDPAAGTWRTTGLGRNSATGYTAAHVYENPGTYTATLSVMDTAGTVHELLPGHHRHPLLRDDLLCRRGRKGLEQRHQPFHALRDVRPRLRGGERRTEPAAPPSTRRHLLDTRRCHHGAWARDHRGLRVRSTTRAEGERRRRRGPHHRPRLEGHGSGVGRAGARRRPGRRHRILEHQADGERPRPARPSHAVPRRPRERRLEAYLLDSARRQRMGRLRGHQRTCGWHLRWRPAPGDHGQRHPRHDQYSRSSRLAGPQGSHLQQSDCGTRGPPATHSSSTAPARTTAGRRRDGSRSPTTSSAEETGRWRSDPRTARTTSG